MTGASEAVRLQGALVSAVAALCEPIDGAYVERRAGYVFLTCPPVPFPQLNGVWAEEDGGNAVADLAGAVSDIDALGLPFWLQTRIGRHPLIEEEATRLGLTRIEQIPGMAATTSDLTELPETEIAIERVADLSQLSQAQAVAESGFDAPSGSMAAFYTEGVAAAPGVSYYLGYAAGEAVSTALGFLGGDTIGVFNVATPPAHRRRGHGAALTARVVKDGFEFGARLAWLQASRQGEPVYRRMGFRTVETYNLFARA